MIFSISLPYQDTTTNEYFCIYYPTDCDESGTEVYVNPTDTLAAGVTCDCSQVHVTVCVGSRGYCALNENGCRDDGDEVAFSPFAQKSGREGTNGIVYNSKPHSSYVITH